MSQQGRRPPRLFELPWLGGAAERRFRRLRPGTDDLPWGTLDLALYPQDLLDRARVHWTQNAIGEYRAAASFAHVLRLALEGGAPLDLVGMASDFVTDELVHTELASRVAMALGGGAPVLLDYEALTGPVLGAEGSPARRRANAAVVRVGCVMETFSKIILTQALASALHPLIRAVLERIARDEVRHARFGWHYMDWAADELDDDDREHLSQVAETALRDIAPAAGLRVEGPRGIELGLVGVGDFPERAMQAITTKILTPLGRFGIIVPEEARREILTVPPPQSIARSSPPRSISK